MICKKNLSMTHSFLNTRLLLETLPNHTGLEGFHLASSHNLTQKLQNTQSKLVKITIECSISVYSSRGCPQVNR